MGLRKHKWVKFINPRNKRVKIIACVNCGIAKGEISKSVQCASLSDSQHLMKKMGWQVMQSPVMHNADKLTANATG